MREDLHRLDAALTAAARLDNPETAAADREADLATVTEMAATVRELAAWVDQRAADTLAWALRVHGGLSQDEVARALGYGQGEGGGRSVRAAQARLAREQARRIDDAAEALVIAAKTGPAARVSVPAPLKVPADRHAAVLAEVHAAADAEAGTGATTRTRASLDAAAKAWGPAAGSVLTRLGHHARQAYKQATDSTCTPNKQQ